MEQVYIRKYYKSQLQTEMRKYYKDKFGVYAYDKVYAEIYGNPMYLNETEVRFLQIKCHECEDFDDFCKNHIIYNGRRKRDSKPMVWRKDGLFATEFKAGFYDTNTKLAFELL